MVNAVLVSDGRPLPVSKQQNSSSESEEPLLTLLLCIALFLMSVIVRAWGISDAGIQNDEQIWHGDGGQFVKSLLGPLGPADFNPAPAAWGTSYVDVGKDSGWPLNIAMPVKHPGIPSGFLIGLGYLFLAEGSSSWSLNLFPLEIAARIPIVLATSLFVVVFFLLARNLFAGAAAGLAALFLVFEPSFVGYSRLARIDVGAGMCATVALLAFLNDVKRPLRRYRFLAGSFYALALLHNPYPVALLPLLIVWRQFTSREGAKLPARSFPAAAGYSTLGLAAVAAFWFLDLPILRPALHRLVESMYRGDGPSFLTGLMDQRGEIPLAGYLGELDRYWLMFKPMLALLAGGPFFLAGILRAGLWKVPMRDVQVLGIALATFLVAYPNLWANPVVGVVQYVKQLFETPHFLGEVGKSWTSPLIYLVYPVLHWSPLFTLSLLTGVGAILQGWLARNGRKGESSDRTFLVPIVLWVGITLLAFSWPPGRKNYKNIMIILPGLSILAGYGATAAARWIGQRFRAWTVPRGLRIVVVLFVLQSIALLHHWYPYYQLMFWTSDPQRWEHPEILGGGEGVKDVADYLIEQGRGAERVLVYIGENNMRYYYRGPVRDAENDLGALRTANWLVVLPKYTFFGVADERYPLKQWIRSHRPEKIFTLNQIEMARLYDLRSLPSHEAPIP